MKKIMFLFILGSMSFAIQAKQDPEPPLRMTLEDCLKYAFKNSYDRQAVKLNEDARKDIYDQSKMERLPDLSASVSENLNHTKANSASWNGNYGISAGVTLFQGGKINETIKQNELLLEQTEYRTSQYDNELTINILQAFLTALGNEELLKYQQAVVKASEEQVKQGKERFNVGQILESDYLLLEAQYATDKTNIVETTISRDNSLLALKSLLSIDPLQKFEIIYPDDKAIDQLNILPSEEYVVERSMISLPDLKISNYEVEIAETGLKVSKSAYYPTISMSGSAGTGHANNFSNYDNQISDKFNAQIGITLSVPLYNKNRTKSAVNQSRIALQQAELEKEQTELDTKQNVIQEYRNVIVAGSKYETSEIKQNAYFHSFEAYRVQFEAGAITTVELLQQQNNYINAMNDFIQNKYGFILKRKILDVYMGERITM